MQHKGCDDCHLKTSPRYPSSRTLKACDTCHAPFEEEQFVFGNGRKLNIAIDCIGGCKDNRVFIEAALTQGLEECEFTVGETRKPDFSIKCVFSTKEVFDEMLPPAAKIRLLWGTCDVSIHQKGREIHSAHIPSKAWSGKNIETIRLKILNNLIGIALKNIKSSIEKAPAGAGK